jgi:uncharacterized protein YeaO (DUF488 family)
MIKTKRMYEPAAKNDGVRVLVDRLWPRGVSKEDAGVDIWLKEIAPSDDLRKWFGHQDDRWDEFQKRYADELKPWEGVLVPVLEFLERDHGTVTLLFAAKDEERNNAAALRSFLQNKM